MDSKLYQLALNTCVHNRYDVLEPVLAFIVCM
jgi:hypothetical protein